MDLESNTEAEMKKLKVYLDSSIVSHLYADDVPEKMRITKAFWDEINEGIYEAVISPLQPYRGLWRSPTFVSGCFGRGR